MGFFRKSLQVARRAVRIQRRLDVDDIAGLQVLGGAVQWQLLEPGQFLMDANDTVAAMIAFTNGDALWV